jgi:hypothetical protein
MLPVTSCMLPGAGSVGQPWERGVALWRSRSRATHLEEQSIEALGRMVDRAGVGGVEDLGLAVPWEGHVDVPFGDLPTRGAVPVDAHRPQVHQVDVQTGLDDAAQHIMSRSEVVVDGVALGCRGLHRVWRGTLLGEVHHRVRLLVLEHLDEAFVLLREVEVDEAHGLLARNGIPGVDARLGGGDRREGAAAEVDVDLPPRQVVDDHHLVTFVREVKCGRPAAEAVATQHKDLLRAGVSRGVREGGRHLDPWGDHCGRARACGRARCSLLHCRGRRLSERAASDTSVVPHMHGGHVDLIAGGEGGHRRQRQLTCLYAHSFVCAVAGRARDSPGRGARE